MVGHISKKNILFLVEGKTEGCSTVWGKGLWNILSVEHNFMRRNNVCHHIKVFHGKQDMMANMTFHVEQHFKKKNNRSVDKPTDDYVFILRDLDCEDKQTIEKKINEMLSMYYGCYSIHFAVQEIEAWMIADVNSFSVYGPNKRTSVVASIRKIPYYSNPEQIDCNPKVSKRLEEIARKCGSRYKKTMEGPQLLKAVNPDIVGKICPSFYNFRNDVRMHIGLSAEQQNQ